VAELGARLEPGAKDQLQTLLSRALSRRAIFDGAGLA
jgi:hypothetical protein